MTSPDRLRTYATAHGLTIPEARRRLIMIALDHLDARTSAGAARWKGTTPSERSDAARKAVTARWASRARRQ